MVNDTNKRQNSKQPSIEDINAQYGKLPPQAVDVEEAVLGALMLERDSYELISNVIDTESFYKDENKKIFECIKGLAKENKPIDLMMVTRELKDRGELELVGGPLHITKLTNHVASAAHIEFHARIIAQKFIQREMIRITSELQTQSYDPSIDIDDLLTDAKTKFGELENFFVCSNPGQTTAVVLENTIKELEADCVAKQKGETPGIPTGLKDLNDSTGGWRNTNFIVLAARPGVGKTSFALYLAMVAASKGFWVNFYGLEMKNADLMRILLSGEADIERTKIRDGDLDQEDWNRVNASRDSMKDLPILWNDFADITASQIKANTIRNRKAGKCDLVIIDYLQLINSTNKRAIREQQIAEISRTLKGTALDQDIPVICLSQLNRDVERRNGGEPNLSDLRESGAIEQDADLVLFLYEDENKILKLKIGKNRRGKRGHPEFWANEEKTRFADFEPSYAEAFDSMPANLDFDKKDDQPF